VPHHLTFTIEGFRSWKRVNDGVKCALLMHMGSPTSPHNNVVKSAEDLMKVSRHIDKVLNAKTIEEVQTNRLRLMTTIEVFDGLAYKYVHLEVMINLWLLIIEAMLWRCYL
jgi:hypothetical protein